MNDSSIGEKLKYLRKSRGLVQQEVADRLDMKRSTYSNYEGDRRTPSMRDLKKIAAFYGVGLDYFGIASADEIMEIVARAREVFASADVPQEKKDDLHRELMKLYLKL